jgi:hypothetical protein
MKFHTISIYRIEVPISIAQFGRRKLQTTRLPLQLILDNYCLQLQ